VAVIVDYHMHLRDPDERLSFTVEAIERFVETAAARGVDEIGFSEHIYYFRQTRSLWTVPYHVERCSHELAPYVDAVEEAKRQGLPVKLGIEVDYVRGREEETRELLSRHPWDFVLGSVHFVDGFGIDGSPRLLDEVGVDETWRRYFEELAAAAASGLFDVLAHPDVVKIWGERPAAVDYAPLLGALDGVCLEVSTAGLRKPVGELYPDPELLRGARERGTHITLASDAHVPRFVGEDFDRALALAREAGYSTVTVFDGRRSRQEPLG
jgi:histidinol-phosphatase (PHP family)